MKIVYWSISGQILEFQAYDYNGRWNYDVGGLYIFAKYDFLSRCWRFFYIGKTESFGKRMNPHPRWEDAAQKGADTVFAVVVNDEKARAELEIELIQLYQPELNDVYNPNSPPKLGLGGILKADAVSPSKGLGAVRKPNTANPSSQLGLGGILKPDAVSLLKGLGAVRR